MKRIVIISPNLKDRTNLKWFLESYIKSNFGRYANNVEVQDFSNLHEPQGNFAIGHLEEGEIAYLIDRHTTPRNFNVPIEEAKRFYDRFLKLSYQKTLELLDEKEIPYIIYKGEITRGKEKELKLEMDNIKEKIKSRLEKKLL